MNLVGHFSNQLGGVLRRHSSLIGLSKQNYTKNLGYSRQLLKTATVRPDVYPVSTDNVNRSKSNESIGRQVAVFSNRDIDSRYNSSNRTQRANSSFAATPPSPSLRSISLLFGQQIRSMSTSRDEASIREKYKPRDIQFKTPYGHIAALEWGRPDAPHKILCNHGWLDNAGSFERLIPFILDHQNNADKYHIVAMDQPGVGLSSHKPPGGEYTQFGGVLDMRRITQELKWDKVTLLSHSLGAHFSFLYCCVYPNQVESMIAIDLAHPLTRQVHNWNVSIANSIEDHFKCEYHHEDDPVNNIRVPVYSKQDAIKRLMDGHSSSLTSESAEVLLKRGAKEQRWGYTFRRDVRLRYLSIEFRPDDDLMLQSLAGTFRPNLFIIRANRSPYHRPEAVRLKYYELFRNNCPSFRDVILEGTHHLHMNTPDTVALEINKFLDDMRMEVKGDKKQTVTIKTQSNL